ncbi:MAG TPA: hypothetical protein VFZ59_21295 [Verrucomicrobiae bacterium]|nr:hypothetical protein [Verrucomicrobiae bacterium]
MIAKEIEAIFAGQDVGEGEVDVDGVLAAFERLKSIATQADLPSLVAAIQSPRNNFWTRELLSEPICELGGPDYLEVLFEAAQLGLDEGHDNDSFHMNLTEMAYAEPQKCRTKLEELLARPDFKHREAATWLLEFCKTNARSLDRN